MKTKFTIFRNDTLDYGDGHVESTKTQVGETWAVSAKQALNNFRYRTGNKDELVPWRYDGCRCTTYAAEPAV